MPEELVIGRAPDPARPTTEPRPGSPRSGRGWPPYAISATAVLIAIVAVMVAVSSVRTAQRVQQELTELQAAQARALDAVEASRVDVADHVATIWVRNASLLPRTGVSLVRVALGSGPGPTPARSAVLAVLPLADLPACHEYQFAIEHSYARRWSLAESGRHDPVWMLVWANANGRRWQRVATPDDQGAGDGSTGADSDPFTSEVSAEPAAPFDLDLSTVAPLRTSTQPRVSRPSTVGCA